MLPQPLRATCLGVFAVALLSGCSLFESEPEQVQIYISVIYGPDQAAPGEVIVFTLHSTAFDASLRVGARSERQAEVTAWALEPCEPVGPLSCDTLQELGRFEAVMPASGEYVLRATQPDGSVLEKRVRVADQTRTSG